MDFDTTYWDLVGQPNGFSTIADDDFLALLHKQFPGTIGNSPKPLDHPPDGVDPQSISTFPLPNPSPPSSDSSSPSPPSAGDTPSRPQSGVFNTPTSEHPSLEESNLKRKASNEDMDSEPSHKSAHTSAFKTVSSSRRKSTGNPHQDEIRLLKRKEQNRAAQRAFRERKEKHVKDLEDKVAALEAKNQAAESENENLRDLLQRLQSENMALKSGQFTFAMPKNGDMSAAPSYTSNTPTQTSYTSPGASGSASRSPEIPPPFDFNFGQMIPFDPATLNVIDEVPPQSANGDTVNMDFDFGSVNQYPRILASNPSLMSFGEPMTLDLTPPQSQQPQSQSPNFNSFGDWSPPHSLNGDNGLTSRSVDSLDQIFGGSYMSAQSPVDFTALLRSPPSVISPVQHASTSRQNSNSSIPASSAATPISPSVETGTSCAEGKCPRTKEDMKKAIQNAGNSPFVDVPPPPPSFLRKSCDVGSGGPMIMCKGSSFPKTEKSDRNVEVLTAWRSITSNPQFKTQDIDINELCTEFTSKARCDGTKVVLEPEGVHHIIETLSSRRPGGQNQQQK
ncbi:hypothetical protein K474DRAFT_1592799 [Panus rudis PR-1116 ss-1]|nr:hypothetical protein K474DRAFT_1592799 [Panus rudis PR-1116 ss-1]